MHLENISLEIPDQGFRPASESPGFHVENRNFSIPPFPEPRALHSQNVLLRILEDTKV